MTNDTRAAFEAWARAENMSLGTLRHIGYAEGTYEDSRTHAAWLGWLASRRAALEEAAKVCEEEYVHAEDGRGNRWVTDPSPSHAEIIRALADEGVKP
jgi:hypothetical protein